MLVDYRKLDTFLHKLNPRISLMFVLAVIIASVVWTDPIVITVATIGLVGLGFACKFPWKQIGWFLKMALFASVLIIVIQGFSLDSSLVTKEMYKGWVLFYVPLGGKRIPFMLDGVLYGYASSLKIYLVVIAVGILGFTVDPAEIIQMLNHIPFASKHFVFIFSTAWRFIPQIQQQLFNLMDAQKTRGMDLDKGKLMERLKKIVPIVTPLLSNALDISDQIALSMEARAFGSGNKNKFVKPASLTPGVVAIVLVEAAVIALMIAAVGVWGFGIM